MATQRSLLQRIDRFAARVLAAGAARFFVGNPYYKTLLQTRFPTFMCFLSEVVNLACYKLKLDRVLMEPRFIFIEPTNTCNIKCIMCPVPDNTMMTRKRKMLTIEELSAILDANPKVRVVYLTNWGEPMLNRNLVEIVAECSRRGLYPVVTSNATLLTPELADSLLHAGLGAIRFSLDGVGEYFERVRSVSYEKVKANIEMFVAARNAGRFPTSVELNVTYMPENIDGVRDVDREWRAKVDFINYQGVIAVPMIKPAERGEREQRHGRCRQIYRSAFFLTNGTVSPCCADYNAELPLGNVSQSRNAFTLMNSAPERELRRRHREGNVPEICRVCTQYKEDIFPRQQSSIV